VNDPRLKALTPHARENHSRESSQIHRQNLDPPEKNDDVTTPTMGRATIMTTHTQSKSSEPAGTSQDSSMSQRQCRSPLPDTEPPKKRGRAEHGDNFRSTKSKGCSSLPPELWANVFEFVEYTDLLQLSLVCRTFLVEALPRVEVLTVTKSRELHVAPTHRFRGVKDLNIWCFAQYQHPEGEDCAHEIDPLVATTTLPFLSRFPELEGCFVGAFPESTTQSYRFYMPEFCETDSHMEIMRGLMRALAGGFSSGMLPKCLANLQGLHCPLARPESRRVADCDVCRQVCQTFPVSSSFNSFLNLMHTPSAREYILATTCLCMNELEIAEILLSRPERNEIDFEDYLEGLLGVGNVVAVDGDGTEVLFYRCDVLDTIDLIMDVAPAQNRITQAQATEALLSNWKNFEDDPDPPLHHRLVLRESFDRLLVAGIPLHQNDFRIVRHTGANVEPQADD
jgi:hypothetical protein